MAMYKGWLGGDIYYFNRWGARYTPAGEYTIDSCWKTMAEALPKDPAIRVTKNPSIVGNIYSWEADLLEKRGQPPGPNNPVAGWEKCVAFENCVFQAKFEIGVPYKTASSCGCNLTHSDFTCSMFLPDLWPLLQTITFDASDPANVKKYIEGKFTFEKRGKAITLVGVQ